MTNRSKPIGGWGRKKPIRIQTGIARRDVDHRWIVVQRITEPGKPAFIREYEPSFATEAEAERASDGLAKLTRVAGAIVGTVIPHEAMN